MSSGPNDWGVAMSAWITKRMSRGVWVYKAQIRTPGGGTRSKTFRRKLDAERWIRDQKTATDRGDWVDPKLGKTTFAEWAPRWVEGRAHLRPSTLAAADSLMRVHILPHFGPLPLASVTPADVAAFVSELRGKGLSASTVRQAYLCARGVFASAVNNELISRTPCRGVKLPKGEAKELRILTPDEVAELAARVDPRYRVMVFVGAFAGLRWGEAAALTANTVDLLHGALTVSRTISDVRGVVTLAEPKTKMSRRRVALPAVLVNELATHLAESPANEAGLLFPAPAGGLMDRDNFRHRVWGPAVKAAGLHGLRFHDLRHSHAAMLIAQGEHPKVIQSRLGHASITVTLDTYGHLFDGLDEGAAERLNGQLASYLHPEPSAEVVELPH